MRVTPYKLALAAVSIYLARRYRCESLPVLTAYANRRGLPDGLEKSVGMFVSTLLLKMDYDPEMTFAGYIQSADQTLKSALAHGRYPLNMLTEELVRKGEDVSGIWNFSVVSNSKPDTTYGYELLPMRTSAFPMVIRVNKAMEDRFGLQTLSFEYFEDVFCADEVARMAEGIGALLADMALDIQKKIGSLEMLGTDEKKRLLKGLAGKNAGV